MTIIKGMKFNLDRMKRLDALVGSASKAVCCVHVAGTNGKGSVCTKIAASLERGRKIGLFTSPHVSTFRERIQINGQLIPEEDAMRLWQYLEAKKVEATFFEWMTLLAFLYFAEQKVDLAVLEVGMGGRLDATNICNPILSVITTIELDHTQLLGTTLEKIAREKGGIIKEKVPLLLGPKAACFPILKLLAEKKKAPTFTVEGIFANYELENRTVAGRALELLGMPYDMDGLLRLPPCRFESVGQVILDVAHNPGGFEALFSRLSGKKVHLLMGLGEDKEVKEVLKVVSQNASHIHLTQSSNPRAAPASFLGHMLGSMGYRNYTVEPDIVLAFEKAKEFACQENALLCVCGTFYIMSAVRKCLDISEPCDDKLLSPY